MRKVSGILVTSLIVCSIFWLAFQGDDINKRVIRDFKLLDSSSKWNISQRKALIEIGSPLAYIFGCGAHFDNGGGFVLTLSLLCPENLVNDRDVDLLVGSKVVSLSHYNVLIKPTEDQVVSDILLSFRVELSDFMLADSLGIAIGQNQDTIFNDITNLHSSVTRMRGSSDAVVYKVIRF